MSADSLPFPDPLPTLGSARKADDTPTLHTVRQADGKIGLRVEPRTLPPHDAVPREPLLLCRLVYVTTDPAKHPARKAASEAYPHLVDLLRDGPDDCGDFVVDSVSGRYWPLDEFFDASGAAAFMVTHVLPPGDPSDY